MNSVFLMLSLLILFCSNTYAGSLVDKNDSEKVNNFKPSVSLDSAVVSSPLAASTTTNEYKIGVFYFPGWKNNQIGAAYPVPWDKIKPYPEREPLSGWYTDGEDANTEQQLRWMADYGIDFVVYDWYWGDWQKKPFLEHALASYLRASNNKLVNFSILWANHNKSPKSLDEFTSMVTYWVNYYFSRPQYQKINGKPVIFVFSAAMLETKANKFGKSTKELLDLANQIAIYKGFSGIYFIGGAGANDKIFTGDHPVSGYSAYSAYDYHTGRKSLASQPFSYSHSYDELDKGYQYNWEWFFKKTNLPYILPMTSGWDKRPWGGSIDSLHDNSVSTQQSFESHLLAAKSYMNKYPEMSLKTGVICCWNEFGEGTYIEPTKAQGFSYLEKVKKVFGGGVP